jgi:hypothetical protein
MIYVNLGRRRQGKTTLTAHMSRKVPARLIFDPRGLMQFGTTVHSRSALALAFEDLAEGTRQEIVYTPDQDLQAEFIAFSRYCRVWAVKHGQRPLAMVVDEAAFVDTDIEDFLWILRCSDPTRHHVFVTAHRPSDLSTRLRAIADHWLLFATRQEHDLAVINQRCGANVSRRVAQLQPREFVHWDDALGVYKHYPQRVAQSWHVPLGATSQQRSAASGSGLEDLESDSDLFSAADRGDE